MTFDDDAADGFVRLHKVFTFHLGVAVGLAWMTALYAALYAPWVRNIRPLIDPTNLGHVEEARRNYDDAGAPNSSSVNR